MYWYLQTLILLCRVILHLFVHPEYSPWTRVGMLLEQRTWGSNINTCLSFSTSLQSCRPLTPGGGEMVVWFSSVNVCACVCVCETCDSLTWECRSIQLGPWGLVYHQKACTLRIDYVNNGRLHNKCIIICKFGSISKMFALYTPQDYNGLHFKLILINLRNVVIL